MRVCVAYVSWCGGQNTTLGSQFSPLSGLIQRRDLVRSHVCCLEKAWRWERMLQVSSHPCSLCKLHFFFLLELCVVLTGWTEDPP